MRILTTEETDLVSGGSPRDEVPQVSREITVNGYRDNRVSLFDFSLGSSTWTRNSFGFSSSAGWLPSVAASANSQSAEEVFPEEIIVDGTAAKAALERAIVDYTALQIAIAGISGYFGLGISGARGAAASAGGVVASPFLDSKIIEGYKSYYLNMDAADGLLDGKYNYLGR